MNDAKSPSGRIRALTLAVVALAASRTAAADPFRVNIRVDASNVRGELRALWRFFGADEPNYAYMKDGKKLLAELGELRPGRVYFRAHNLLTSGDGTPALKWGSSGAYREDSDGKPLYDWTILDRIFDTYVERGVKPYAQIGFMPKDLSVKPEPYQHTWKPGVAYERVYTGWAHPPKDYGKWAELVFRWAKHCVERYGGAEVETWYWQVWNEPNIGYWQGSPDDFYRLHDTAIDAVRRALPTARVGGPDTAGGGRFLRRFLEHCLRGANRATGKTGTPLDFISFHAKGAPRFVDGHVRMGIANQLRVIDDSLGIIASFRELRGKPVVIGESDPDGCAACTATDYPQNGYRNGTMFSSYTAACFARKHELAERHNVNLVGALTWAFEFEGQPYFAGFRSLATNGIDKPVLNVFRMFSRMRGDRLQVESDGASLLDEILRSGVRGRADVSALASLDGSRLCVLAWHYHDDDVPGPDAEVTLELDSLPLVAGEARVEHFRIDEDHSNAFTAWQRMGRPEAPTPEQYEELEAAGQLTALRPPRSVRVMDARATLRFVLPRQAVSLLVVTWDAGARASGAQEVEAAKTAARAVGAGDALSTVVTRINAIPAFPGAEGYGARTPGGRRGAVLLVTNLNDSGPGSLREAINTPGPRTIIFRVSGTITLESPLSISDPYVTIAGQSAPGDGICIRGETTQIDTHDVVIRYLRFRRGILTRRDDALGGNPVGNLIIDHCSCSWGLDENISIYRHMKYTADGFGVKMPTENVTIQWTISSEALNPFNHAFGGTWGGRRASLHHNLFACNTGRNPSIGWGDLIDFRNNVIFNWRHRTVDGGDGGSLVNVVANYYKPGPATNDGSARYRICRPQHLDMHAVSPLNGKWYVAGNHVEGHPEVTADNWRGGVQFDGVPDEKVDEVVERVRATAEIAAAPITQQSAIDAYERVLADVGANRPGRDAVDERILEAVRTGAPTVGNGIIVEPGQVGGWPELSSTAPAEDSDGDGMPDEWETRYGLDPRKAQDGRTDVDGDGYTNVEEWLNHTDPTKFVDYLEPRNNHSSL